MKKHTKLLLEEIKKDNPNIALIEKYINSEAELFYGKKYDETIIYQIIDNMNYYFRDKFDKYDNKNLYNNNKDTKIYLKQIVENYDYSLLEKIIQRNGYLKGNNEHDWELLHNATFSFNYKIVEMLVNAGVNVNCNDINDGWNSFLDWIEYDKSVFRDEHNIIAVIGEEIISNYVKKMGAKGWSTTFNKNIEEDLIINRYSKTGLISNYGLIKISSLKILNNNFIKDFRNWHKNCRKEKYYLSYPWEYIKDTKNFVDYIHENNRIGLKLSKQFKSYLEKDIQVTYYETIPEEYLKWRHGSYCRKEILI